MIPDRKMEDLFGSYGKVYNHLQRFRLMEEAIKQRVGTRNLYVERALFGKNEPIEGHGNVQEFINRLEADRAEYHRNWIKYHRAKEERDHMGNWLDELDHRANALAPPSMKVNYNPSRGPSLDIGMFRPIIRNAGRHGDTEIAHLTKGEVVLPEEVARTLQNQIKEIMNKDSLDELTVGKGKINPETGLEEFWQEGYIGDPDPETGKRGYIMHWKDYRSHIDYLKYGTGARRLTGKKKTKEWWEDKDITSQIGQLDPEGDFTARERREYEHLARSYYKVLYMGRMRRRRYWNTESNEPYENPIDTSGISHSTYNKYYRKTAGSWGHDIANKEKRLLNWEKHRNKRLQTELVERQRLEEEALIREQEREAGIQRALELRTKRGYAEQIGRLDEGRITAAAEQTASEDPQSYSAPKYTTRRRSRERRISNPGFFFNV